jgi:hypothetical protein
MLKRVFLNMAVKDKINWVGKMTVNNTWEEGCGPSWLPWTCSSPPWSGLRRRRSSTTGVIQINPRFLDPIGAKYSS